MNWQRFFHRDKADAEQRDELEFHVDVTADEYIAKGMDPAAARDAARRKLGNTTCIREEVYRMNTITFLDSLGRDIRYGLRLLRHNLVFTSVALLTLAIGIGANTAVFTVLNSVLFKPLAYPNPEELVAVWSKAPGAEGIATVSGDLRLSASMYFTFAEQNSTLQALESLSQEICCE